MRLSIFNWILFPGFFAMVIGFSRWKSRGSSGDGEDYFLAGRRLSWWLIGILIAAATVSTEQFVGMAGQGAGSVREGLDLQNDPKVKALGGIIIVDVIIFIVVFW